MNYTSTSRRDDLKSACYLLLTLLNQNHFPMAKSYLEGPCEDEASVKKRYKDIHNHKKKYGLQTMS